MQILLDAPAERVASLMAVIFIACRCPRRGRIIQHHAERLVSEKLFEVWQPPIPVVHKLQDIYDVRVHWRRVRRRREELTVVERVVLVERAAPIGHSSRLECDSGPPAPQAMSRQP